VLDVNPQDPLENFRSMADWRKHGGSFNPTGLDELRLSGSAQFSPAALRMLKQRVGQPLFILDLRQESHGYIQGHGVTWQAGHDWVNVGLSHDEVLKREQKALQALEGQPRISLESHHSKRSIRVQGRSVESEEHLVQRTGVHYVRLTATDHLRPDDQELDRFIEAVRGLPPKAWVHMHCRAGKGRTSTFMVLYDMVRNAKDVPFAEIMKRQRLLSNYDVEKLPEVQAWQYPYRKDRAELMKSFYAYAQENPNGRPLLWSQWLTRR
jgi:protein-tyrosine phosphatase